MDIDISMNDLHAQGLLMENTSAEMYRIAHQANAGKLNGQKADNSLELPLKCPNTTSRQTYMVVAYTRNVTALSRVKEDFSWQQLMPPGCHILVLVEQSLLATTAYSSMKNSAISRGYSTIHNLWMWVVAVTALPYQTDAYPPSLDGCCGGG